MEENNQKKCNCKKKKCERHGNCVECIAHHKENTAYSSPYCERNKRKITKGNKQKEKE